jgi:hypothetical protein
MPSIFRFLKIKTLLSDQQFNVIRLFKHFLGNDVEEKKREDLKNSWYRKLIFKCDINSVEITCFLSKRKMHHNHLVSIHTLTLNV